ncbi:PP2C family serine/threonine-protein phosphatase [Roseibium sp. HPY-6]|uniref:PP2C family serine/threonine-protein phosphatase n=1 Tax=Roseibium sp. HPY-6 TaxID=3229852 RepID=UPI00338F539A
MTPNQTWMWVGATSTGIRHLKKNEACQDSATAFEVRISDDDSAFIAIVSDGAGSTKFGGIGSAITCRTFARLAKDYLLSGQTISSLSDELVKEWVEVTRYRISKAAKTRESKMREFAATLVMAIVGENDTCFIQIGDGACVFKTKCNGHFGVPIVPMHGEYASSTYFITDMNTVRFERVIVNEAVQQIAVLTDGIEKLAILPDRMSADEEFFHSLFQPFENFQSNGRNREFSKFLRSWLASEAICERTDDDKSLILAQRSDRKLRPAVSNVDSKSSEAKPKD